MASSINVGAAAASPESTFDSWEFPPATLELRQNQVHVWRAHLSLPSPVIRSLARTLSSDERARADQFRFQQDRESFIAAHGLLRTTLCRYPSIAPSEMKFSSDGNGKPCLAKSSASFDLRFNISHSHGIALFAVANGREVGVDIERERADMDFMEIAGRFFSMEECNALRGFSDATRRQTFFSAWARKEAFLKGVGKGLSGELSQPDASFMAHNSSSPIAVDSNDPALRWSVRDLSVHEGYAAALAVEGSNCELSLFMIQD